MTLAPYQYYYRLETCATFYKSATVACVVYMYILGWRHPLICPVIIMPMAMY